MPIVVYLDTWAPRLILAKKAADRSRAARLFAQLERGDYDVRVPQIAVGEAVTTVMRDFGPGEWEEPACKMLRSIEGVSDPATCFPPPDPETAELAGLIMTHVGGMTNADSFVAAHAVQDPLSQKLVTNDAVLMNTPWLTELEQRRRQDGKRIKKLKINSRL